MPLGAANTISSRIRPITNCQLPVSHAATYNYTNSNTKAPMAWPDPPRMAMKTISPERTQ